MVKVFFGCSMRGGHDAVSREDLARIPQIIEGLGYRLMSTHQTEAGVITREDELEPHQIHDRDYEWLQNADVGIFEISNPSLGVGGEISDMIHRAKPVLCLYRRDLGTSVSAYVRGKDGSRFVSTPFGCKTYASLDEIGGIIRDFVDTHL